MNLADHYRKRAQEYEDVYHRPDPVRQAEQSEVADAIKHTMAEKRVLEVACGTGYWTQSAAETAEHIVATDLVEETLAIARTKNYPKENVEFRTADAYSLTKDGGPFTAGLCCFWLSHIPKARMQSFLTGFHKVLEPGAVVFIADNVLVEDIGGTLVRKPDEEDTYKIRTLKDDSKHEILKNYYDREELQNIFSDTQNLHIEMRSCFWWARYNV